MDGVACSTDMTQTLTSHFHDHVPGLELRMVEQFIDRVDRRARDAGLVELCNPILNRLARGDRLNGHDHCGAIAASQVIAHETWIERQRRRSKRIGHQHKKRVVTSGYDDATILCGEALERSQRRVTVAGATRYLTFRVITRERRLHQRRLAVKHANIDTRSLRILHSFVEGGDDAYSSEKSSTKIAKAGPDA